MISVIIPTYKPGAYLWKCLDSLESQTMDKQQYEVIIILNGCRDPYYEHIIHHIGKYSMNIHVAQTDVAGVSNARNIGLDISKGEQVCFVDDDDWVSEEYLQQLFSAVKKTGFITVSNVEAIDETSGKTRADYLSSVYQSLCSQKTVGLLKARRLLSSSCCKMIPKEVIGKDRFNTRLSRGEDALFMAQISSKVKGVALADAKAVYFRLLRTGSASRSDKSLKRACGDFLLQEYSFLKVYLSDIRHYNHFFFLGRFLAVFKGTIIKYFSD